ncbi:MAG: pyridoxamine 5'-phosphate oxidase family protein [Halobacteriales archaeon]|nr:pyridoxamine 5'-phosphate oxidase family protein [Halobacteriales archaeon]
MAVATATAMDALEISEFLSGQGTGVLALAKDASVYAFPVSFAYHEDGPKLYFRLGYGPDSQKRAYVEGADEATFVAYDHTEAGWKSVLAEGTLEAVSGSKLDTSVEEAVKGLQIPYFQVHREPSADLEFAIVRLDVDKLSGIVEAQHSR